MGGGGAGGSKSWVRRRSMSLSRLRGSGAEDISSLTLLLRSASVLSSARQEGHAIINLVSLPAACSSIGGQSGPLPARRTGELGVCEGVEGMALKMDQHRNSSDVVTTTRGSLRGKKICLIACNLDEVM
eukprot:730692-Hanusia_phi.AAC.2